ncbi:MAG: chemotaxis protein CheW [Oligoflexia bacterium]|nr:chemotaxis protein CheW [Oligoflexia bacterium]
MSKNINTIKILQLVEFVLGNDTYALPLNNVQEIIKIVEIIYIPKAPSFVEGVINLRDKIVPVIDLKKRFDIKNNLNEDNNKIKIKASSRIIISEIASHTIGLIVDHVKQVINVEESHFENKPEITNSIDQDFIEGMLKYNNKIIIILNPNKILSSSETNNLNCLK